MKITKCTKAVVYAVAAACLTALAVWIADPLHGTTDLVAAYQRSDILLFSLACCVLGVGVYSFIGYTRRHPEHRVDSWFFMLIGAVMLVATVVLIVRFGGITEENFDTTANAAVNLNVGLAALVPLPFAVRSWILACTAGFSKRERTVALTAAAVPTVLYAVLALCGKLLFQVSV